MKRTILTTICLVVLTSLTACDSSQENSGLTSAGEHEDDSAEEPTGEQTPAGGDLDNPTAHLTGPLSAAGAVRCVEQYSPATVVNRAFAFDGVVTDIGSGESNRPDRGHLELVGVTFAVREWFSGGSGSTVTIDMESPVQEAPRLPEGVPSYAVASRLLVSGEPRWGGPPLEDAIAWGCGFTRYYDPVTAALWRQAFADVADQAAWIRARSGHQEVTSPHP